MASSFENHAQESVTSSTTIVSCPVNTTMTVVGMTVTNVSGLDTNVTVSVNNTRLLLNATVFEGSAIVPIGGDQKVVLTADDTLSVTADNTVDVFVSVLKTTI